MIKRYKDFINESSSAMIKFKGTKDRVKFAIHSFSLRGHDGKVTFLSLSGQDIHELVLLIADMGDINYGVEMWD